MTFNPARWLLDVGADPCWVDSVIAVLSAGLDSYRTTVRATVSIESRVFVVVVIR